KRLEKLPFRIAHQSANHFCLPQEAVLNHIAAWLRIPLSTGPSSSDYFVSFVFASVRRAVNNSN
ncbi:MAG: hypothetical protein ACREHF_06635, partial [Rhizomicrobium sp.]